MRSKDQKLMHWKSWFKPESEEETIIDNFTLNFYQKTMYESDRVSSGKLSGRPKFGES